MSLITPIPNGPFYSAPSYYVNSTQGYLIVGTGLSVAPDGTLLSASALGGTVTQVTAGTGLSGGTITTTGTIALLPATTSTLGGIKVGANLLVAPDGTLSAATPGTGTISGVTAGNGLQGGGITGNVLLSLVPATTTQLGGVSIGNGIDVATGTISLAAATPTRRGGVLLASSAEVTAGTDANKAVTPATLQAKVASTTAPGIVQLSNSVATNDNTKAATQTAAKTAYDAAIAAQGTATSALSKAGGTMTGIITFAAGQSFPGVSLPVATTLSLGVVQIGTGLSITPSGILSTANNGTVTSIVPGQGLGAPATGNAITTSGTIRLLPPTTDGLQLGGVKAGNNILIGVDGTISVPNGTFLAVNNPYAYNGYLWPISNAAPALPCPGTPGQVLTIVDSVTGQLAWTNTGTLTTVAAGTGIAVTSTGTTATVSIATVPSTVPGDYGATALIPTLHINQYGQVTSTGQANPYAPFQLASIAVPTSFTLDFSGNNLNWEWTLQANLSVMNPLNAQSGQTGALLIRQNPLSPYTITWGSAWKFEDFTPYTGNPTVAGVDLILFTVVAANYIVVTKVVKNIG
jgi:hypothetical protein